MAQQPAQLDRTLRRHQPHWSTSALSLTVLPGPLKAAALEVWAQRIADAGAALVNLLERALDPMAARAPRG